MRYDIGIGILIATIAILGYIGWNGGPEPSLGVNLEIVEPETDAADNPELMCSIPTQMEPGERSLLLLKVFLDKEILENKGSPIPPMIYAGVTLDTVLVGENFFEPSELEGGTLQSVIFRIPSDTPPGRKKVACWLKLKDCQGIPLYRWEGEIEVMPKETSNGRVNI